MNKTIEVCDLCKEPVGDKTMAFDLPGGKVHVCSGCQIDKDCRALIEIVVASLKLTPWQTCRCRAYPMFSYSSTRAGG